MPWSKSSSQQDQRQEAISNIYSKQLRPCLVLDVFGVTTVDDCSCLQWPTVRSSSHSVTELTCEVNSEVVYGFLDCYISELLINKNPGKLTDQREIIHLFEKLVTLAKILKKFLIRTK